MIKQIGLPLRGRPIPLITRMITDRIGLHSVLLPLLILFVLEASFSTGDVLFFHDMAGVFYAVIFGLLISFLVLLGELTWAAHKDKKQNKVNIIIISH